MPAIRRQGRRQTSAPRMLQNCCFCLGGSAPHRRVLRDFVSPPRASHFLKREKVTKALAPASGSRFAGLPSLHRSFRGTPRRAIPGPSQLSRHPCRSTPEISTPLGLLKGHSERAVIALEVLKSKQSKSVEGMRFRRSGPCPRHSRRRTLSAKAKRGIVGASLLANPNTFGPADESRAWPAPTKGRFELGGSRASSLLQGGERLRFLSAQGPP